MVGYTKKGKKRERGEHDHLYQRGKEGTYYFLFRYPKFYIDWWVGVPKEKRKLRIEHSLGTSDYNEAVRLRDLELAAIRAELSFFKTHISLKDKVGTRIRWRQEPFKDKVDHGDGVYSIATNEHIIFVDKNSIPLADRKTIPNASWEEPNRGKEQTPGSLALHQEMREAAYKADPELAALAARFRKKAAHKLSRDDEIVRFYIDNKGLRKADANETRKALVDFRKLHPGVTLEDATFEQASSLCLYYQMNDIDDAGHIVRKGNIHKVARKKVRWLSQALRFCGEKIVPSIRRNPFSGATPIYHPPAGELRRRSKKRIQLDDEETHLFTKYMASGKMPPEMLLLAILCMTTGMRPAEALAIVGEQRMGRFRCVTVGAKLREDDEIHERTIPLPPCVISYLPKQHRIKIDGKLFPKAPSKDDREGFRYYCTLMSKRMMRHFRSSGITDPAKVFYCFRHRAIGKMVAGRVPDDVQLEIVGHEEFDGVHRSYIHGQSAYSKEQLADAMMHIWKELHVDHLLSIADDLPLVLDEHT